MYELSSQVTKLVTEYFSEVSTLPVFPETSGGKTIRKTGTSLPLEGEPLAHPPPRLIEENLWRAIRYGLSGDLIELERGEVLPARARLERLLEWVAPVAEEIGTAPYLAIPERNAAERQIARYEEGATLEQIYAEQVGVPVRG